MSAEDEAYGLYAAWLGRDEDDEGGEAADIEDLCRERPEAAAELRRLHAEQLHVRLLLQRYFSSPASSATIDTDGPTPAEGPGSSAGRLGALPGGEAPGERYRSEGELARGGMGRILRVYDVNLRRHLAMKVALHPEEDGGGPETPPTLRQWRSVARFLEEAQITGQLDHPGIVPVHELGLDEEGRLYFTMKLVRGRDLRAILELVRYGADGWTLVRALGVLRKVCEAMAYAHAKGVIHRDLKPANVMVGSYGEVYVMDWGLARILARDAPGALDLEPVQTTRLVGVRDEAWDADGDSSDSPLATHAGEVLGTPHYMPPEQADGDLAALGPHSDVYAVGAMLYQLLSGHPPYARPGEHVGRREIWRRVCEGPPLALRSAAPDAPLELVAICERAMAREAAQRYPDMSALGADLAAFLEGRVVAAYGTGTWARARKWIGRNRALASALGLALLALTAGLATSLRAARAESLARGEAERLRDDALGRERELRVRGLIQDLAEFEALARSPAHARQQERPVYAWWLERARLLVDGRPADLAAEWRPGLAEVEALLATRPAALGAPSDERWWSEQLARLADDLRSLRERLSRVEQSLPAWELAIEAIASSPRYGGLLLTPQVGLVPIGPDPSSGLMEFAHLDSGEIPHRSSAGHLVPAQGMGIVFVLLPGGPARMGAQREHPDQPHYDPRARSHEGPVHGLELSPFFLSKYELTQGQWQRAGGALHSQLYRRGDLVPISYVDWHEWRRLEVFDGLTLPTEAQWEYACRAGTASPWWSGDEPSTLEGVATLARVFTADRFTHSDPTDAGGTLPNAFGLHEMHGNLWEWCEDAWDPRAYAGPRGRDPRVAPEDGAYRVIRGGSIHIDADHCRSAQRGHYAPELQRLDIGLRPARPITP